MPGMLEHYDIFRSLRELAVDAKFSQPDIVYSESTPEGTSSIEDFGRILVGWRHPRSLQITSKHPLPCPKCGYELGRFRFISAPAGMKGRMRRRVRNRDTGALESHVETAEEVQERLYRDLIPKTGKNFVAIGQCNGRVTSQHQVAFIGSVQFINSSKNVTSAPSIVIHSMDPSYNLLRIPPENSLPPILESLGLQAGSYYLSSSGAAANRLRVATEMFIDILRAQKEMTERQQSRDDARSEVRHLQDEISKHAVCVDERTSSYQNAKSRSAIEKTKSRLAEAQDKQQSLNASLALAEAAHKEAARQFDSARSNWLALTTHGSTLESLPDATLPQSFKSLSQRIQMAEHEGLFKMPGTKEALLALKAICNDGSHAGASVTENSVLEAAEVLSEIFVIHFTDHLQQRLYNFAIRNGITSPRSLRG